MLCVLILEPNRDLSPISNILKNILGIKAVHDEILVNTYTMNFTLISGSKILGTGSHMGPPAFLSVDNFQLCLDNRNVSSSSEWCMPENKPEKCSNGSWTKLKSVFHGSACPPVKVALNAGM